MMRDMAEAGASTRLHHRVVPRHTLDADARATMLALMRRCYDDVDAGRFARDLDAKQFVVLLLDEDRAIRGFSTIRLADERVGGRTVELLFSGDTVLDPACWGSKALQKGFGQFVIARRLRRPWVPIYWLLLSKGYKTYLLLVNNFTTAFPRREHEPPAELRAFRDRVAAAWWGADYDAGRELLRFSTPRDRLRTDVACPSEADRAQPDVAYFLARNPGWADGDELVCLAEMRARDLGRALIKARVGRWPGLTVR